MNEMSLKTRSFLAGMFIITAYGVLISEMTNSAVVIMFADVISGLSVIGIAVLLYPVLKSSGRLLCVLYLLLKLLEGGLMLGAGFLYMFENTSGFREWIYDGIHLYTFIISALFLYILVYKSRIIPRFVAVWGYSAVFVLSLSTILRLFNAKPAFIDYFLILIITNEIFMAGWLMIKGIHISDPQQGASEE